MAYHGILIVVPCAIQEDLVVYFMYNSLHLLLPDSQSVPSTTPALLSTSLNFPSAFMLPVESGEVKLADLLAVG